jgi:RNA polymerase sigma factor (sigma-70 family)
VAADLPSTHGVVPWTDAADDPTMSQDADSDEALVARCRGGDGTAWQLLVQRYQRLVHAIVRRAGLDEHAAADVFQTVFLRLVQHLPRIVDPTRLQAWIVTTAKRETFEQRRRADRMVPITAGDDDTDAGFESTLVDSSPHPDEAVEHWQLLVQVQLALERLDERCQRLIQVLFGDNVIDYGEAAERLGMPAGSLGPTRARCLEKLRRLVD